MHEVFFKILKKYVSLQNLYFVTPCDYIINGNQYIRLYFFFSPEIRPTSSYSCARRDQLCRDTPPPPPPHIPQEFQVCLYLANSSNLVVLSTVSHLGFLYASRLIGVLYSHLQILTFALFW